MKKQLLILTFSFISMAFSMQEPAVTIKFADHLALPDGHMRAIYEPLTKQIRFITVLADDSMKAPHCHDLFLKESKTSIFEKVRLNLICGILQYNKYVFYGIIGTQHQERDTIIIGRQNMITNATNYAWTEKLDPNISSFFSISSLIFSKTGVAAEVVAFEKTRKVVGSGLINLGLELITNK